MPVHPSLLHEPPPRYSLSPPESISTTSRGHPPSRHWFCLSGILHLPLLTRFFELDSPLPPGDRTVFRVLPQPRTFRFVRFPWSPIFDLPVCSSLPPSLGDRATPNFPLHHHGFPPPLQNFLLCINDFSPATDAFENDFTLRLTEYGFRTLHAITHRRVSLAGT